MCAARPTPEAARRRLTGAAATELVVVATVLVVATVIAGLVLPRRAVLIAVRGIMLAALFLGGGACLVTGLRRRGVERAWRLLVGMLLVGVGGGMIQVLTGFVGGGPAVPRATPAYLIYLVPQAFGLAGVLLYPTHPVMPRENGTGLGRLPRWPMVLVLDGLVVTGAVTLLAWIFVLEEAVGAGPLTEGPIFTIVIVAANLVLTVVVILVAAFRQGRAEKGLGLLVAGLLAMTVTFTWYASAVVRGLTDVPPIADTFLVAAPLLIGLAALAPDGSRAAGAARAPTAVPPAGEDEAAWSGAQPGPFLSPRRRVWHAMLPYLPLAVAVIVTLVEISGENLGHQEELWLLVGIVLVAVVRQMTTVSENVRLIGRIEEKQRELRYQAFHDPLTGLANRSLFLRRLDRALAARGPAAASSLSCSATWTTSNTSTTPSGTPPAMICSGSRPTGWPGACARRTRSRASAATSSRSC